jgi:malonate-semialdehyde dehydrogenase (acetylating)/methylmalonate-semialdehyde dehydrogenase
VGSTPVAKYIYSTGTAHGKRVQALGGAKNSIVLLPDAPLEKSVRAMLDSCLGCAGERCLAGSLMTAIGDETYEKMKDLTVRYAKEVVTGYGMDKNVTMGPVITDAAKKRILNDIETAIKEGAKLILDGRNVKVPGGHDGHFIGPTIFEDVKPGTLLATKEIFGPVIGLMKMNTLDEAIEFINGSNYANTTSIFTSNGPAARYFCSKVHPSMIGVNLGVPAPMSFFSFGGSKDSFFGDAKAHGSSCIEFFTEKHISMIRWFGDGMQDVVSPHWSGK